MAEETTTIRVTRSTKARLDPHLKLFTQDALVRCMLNLWEKASPDAISDAMTEESRAAMAARQRRSATI